MTSYVRGRVALLGDAAHAMVPALGQGACQAVLDLVALTECLGGRDDVDGALVAYDRQRRRATKRIVLASRTLMRVMGTRRAVGLRDTALRLLPV